MVKYTQIQVKSVLNRLKHIDSWYWTRYTINCYQGCQIGCIYCHSRNDRYHLPQDFDQDIRIKENLPSILETELQRSGSGSKNYQPDVVGISGATDPYQAAERKSQLTRKTLELCLKYKFPVHIITKSQMIKRDLEILEAIAKSTWATISVTLTTTDPDHAQFLEQGAPSPQNRLELMEFIKTNYPKIQVGVSATPILPFFSDDQEMLVDLVDAIKQAKADYMLHSVGLSMNNQQAQWFLQKIKDLDTKVNDINNRYVQFQELYGFTDKIFSGVYDGKSHVMNHKMREKHVFVTEYAEKIGLNTSIARWLPDDYRYYNYLLAEEIFNEIGRMTTKNPLYFAAMNLQNLQHSIVDAPELISQLTPDPKIQEYLQQKLEGKNWKKSQFSLDDYF